MVGIHVYGVCQCIIWGGGRGSVYRLHAHGQGGIHSFVCVCVEISFTRRLIVPSILEFTGNLPQDFTDTESKVTLIINQQK